MAYQIKPKLYMSWYAVLYGITGRCLKNETGHGCSDTRSQLSASWGENNTFVFIASINLLSAILSPRKPTASSFDLVIYQLQWEETWVIVSFPCLCHSQFVTLASYFFPGQRMLSYRHLLCRSWSICLWSLLLHLFQDFIIGGLHLLFSLWAYSVFIHQHKKFAFFFPFLRVLSIHFAQLTFNEP